MTALQTTEDAASVEQTDAAARAFVQRLHDEAMQRIADLAENWTDAEPEPAELISVQRISELPAPPPVRPLVPSAQVLATLPTDQIAVQQATDEPSWVPVAA